MFEEYCSYEFFTLLSISKILHDLIRNFSALIIDDIIIEWAREIISRKPRVNTTLVFSNEVASDQEEFSIINIPVAREKKSDESTTR